MKNSFSLKQLKYLFEYVFFILWVKIMRLLTLEQSANICAYLGKKIGPYLGATKVAKRNIEQNLKLKNSDKIIDDLWDNFGRLIGEFPYIDILPEMEINKRVLIEGLENLAEFREKKQPFLVFSGHFANWELTMRIATQIYPKIAVVYRHANNPYIDEFINNMRSVLGIKFILKGPKGVKDLIRAIKEGYTLVLLVDQKMKKGIKVPFFGKEVMTNFGIAKLALTYNYSIVPLRVVRLKDSNFIIKIYPKLETQNIANDANGYLIIMTRINQYLEKWINEYPHQWLCFHKRWD